MSKEQIDDVSLDQYRITANAVYKFLVSLPELLARSVFKQIVKEAHDIASCYPVQEVIPQLAEAISKFCVINDCEQANLHLSKFLGVDPYTLTRIIYNKEELEHTLKASRWESLPPVDNLVKAFECFTLQPLPGDIYEIDTWERLERMKESSDASGKLTHPLYENYFYKLGYLTGLFNNDEEKNDDLIFHCLCEGYIMDIVFKCIWDNSNQQIAVALYENLMAACRSRELATICNKRYEAVRKTRSGWPFVKFEHEDSKVEPIPAIGKLVVKGSMSDMDYDLLCLGLYGKLFGKYIDCDATTFINIFSDKDDVQPIVWIADSFSMVSFAHNIHSKKPFNEIAQDTFYARFSRCINTANPPLKIISFRGTYNAKDKKAKTYDPFFEEILKEF